MTYRISKRFHWSAAHKLNNVPPDHPCARLHGHNYTAEFILESDTLDSQGFVLDYREMGLAKEMIDEQWDHRNLNECWPFTAGIETTAENIAKGLYKWAAAQNWPIAAVRVSETPKTWAEYHG